jgi:two-component system osmolarity sensor histidine kinase EnvZ
MRTSFLPRSLRARMILLTLVTILLVQAATIATVTYYRKQFTEKVAVEFTVTTIRTLRAALAEIPAEERAEFVQSASQNEWRLWSRSLPANSIESRYMRAARAARHEARPATAPNDIRHNLQFFIEALNERLNDGTRVALSRGARPQHNISLLPDPGTGTGARSREWLVIPLDHVAPPVATPLIVVWLGVMIAFLLLAAAFAWHITRPLTRLTKAADQLAAGQPQRVAPSGPTETRSLGERFNAMLDSLAESSAVRRTLLAGLPHDLKGPLSRMWLRIEMSDDSTFKDGMRKDIHDMQRMIDQFIGFVRGTDPGTYHFAPLALNVWLEEQVAAWESPDGIVQLSELWPQPLTLNADRIAMGRLLDNLITNALNHGKPPVEIALTADTPGYATLTISDHGPGISADRRAEALRPFSRLDEARTLTGSVGLGLALADAIVRAHDGTLALGEATSGGLKITIKLPLRESAA